MKTTEQSTRNKDVLIFPHIPKTGGTSIRKFLEKTEKDIFFDYDHPAAFKPHLIKMSEKRNWDFSKLDFSPFDMVFGHFPLKRYHTQDGNVILLLRDPVERVISSFYYWKDILPVSNQLAISRNPEILEVKEGRIDILQFAAITKQNEEYQRVLGRPDTQDFRLVGFTDNLDEFVEKLSGILDVPNKPLGKERENVSKPKLSPEIIDKLKAFLVDDIYWFNAQKDIWA